MSSTTTNGKSDADKRPSKIDSSMPPPAAPASASKKEHAAPPTPDAHSVPMTLPTNGERRETDGEKDPLARFEKRLLAIEEAQTKFNKE